MIYYENIVNVTIFFLLLPRFRNNFFFPQFSAMPLPQLLQFFFSYFGNDIAAISLSHFFFFFFTLGTPRTLHTWTTGIRQRNFGIHITEIQHFLSPPFFFFSLILFVKFWQWWYRNSLSFLTILNNFQQFL